VEYRSEDEKRKMKDIEREYAGFALQGILSNPELVKDIDGNIENSEKTYKKWMTKFEEIQKKNLRTIKDYSNAFQYMRKLIAKTACDRFLYALFPNAVESMKVNKVLKKLPGDLNCYDLLDGLSYVTADINREMAELAEWIKKNEQIRKSIENDDYNTLTDKYPELKSRLEAFLAKYGSKSDFNCYCFISRSWREEPDRFLNVLKPMIKAEENKTPSKEEGLQRYNNILKQVEGILSPKKYADFKRRAEAYVTIIISEKLRSICGSLNSNTVVNCSEKQQKYPGKAIMIIFICLLTNSLMFWKTDGIQRFRK
jgi:pyruvate,water dikinase